MTRINLLPWRELRRKQRQRDFIILIAAAAVLAAVAVLGVNFYVARQIEHQVARNDYLRGEIAQLARAAQEIQKINEAKDRLLSRLEIIQSLQASRPVMVRIFDALAHLLPEDLYLDSFRNENGRFILRGTARSNNVVSHFMRNLNDSALFSEPALRLVENTQVNGVRVSAFELAVGRAQPKNAADGEAAP